MDFNATIDLIIKDLKEASDIIDDLKKYPGIPVLQVELAKMKCRSAGEVIAILKTQKESSPMAVNEPVQQKKVQTQKAPEEEKPPIVREKVPVIPEVKKIETGHPESELPPVVKVAAPKKNIGRQQESPIIADQFSNQSGSLVEQLGNIKSEEEIADILKTKPITTLTEAIGINDKFLFIREIFNGNQSDYSQALSRLESAESLADARAVIMSYTGDSSDNEAVNQLLDLVKRKLPPDE